MQCGIISIGQELTTGQCVDTNAAWLSGRLAELGVPAAVHVTVGDEVAEIAEAVRRMMARFGLIVVTGGLGPTPDDVTRAALASALEVGLTEDSDALARIEGFFDRIGRTMSDSNRVQALIPAGAKAMPNPRGTAPGVKIERDGVALFALPGVPAEMRAMFDESVRPFVEARTAGRCILQRRINCFGISESRVGELLSDLMEPGREPNVGTTVGDGVIVVRIIASGASREEAAALAAADERAVCARLKLAVFGRDEQTLQAAVGSMLVEAGLTIAVAESCTGGLLAKYLTDVPGSSRYFSQGWITYANEAKVARLGVDAALLQRFGAVSAEVAEAMAAGCRERAETDVGVSVTGIAGPDGGTETKPVGLVHLGLATASEVSSKRLLLGEHLDRSEVRDRAARCAMDWVRRHLSRR
ncbi:MAG: competence/damage-inducible protein A [Phycisphaerae bacterium]